MRPQFRAARPAPTTGHRPTTALATGLGLCLASLLAAPTAMAQNFTLQLEPAAAFWLDKPQSDRFQPGFYGALRPGVSLADGFIGVQWSYAALLVPRDEGFDEAGSAHFFSTGLRLRPLGPAGHPEEQLGGLWLDLNLGYVRTADLGRFGPDVGLGYGFQIADALAVGPALRYGQILQPDNVPNVDPNDAQFLTLGLNISLGPKVKRAEPVPECPECAETAAVPPVDQPPACADGDRDGVCDADDRCPDDIGPAATLGCPIDACTGEPLVVLVQFSEDSAGMPIPAHESAQMDPVLDRLADAMKKDSSCRVCIIGHASEDGTSAHNQALSVKRAEAVKRYMVSKGLTESRMPLVGQGESCNLIPEVGRPLNRRVEFLRLDEGQSCPSTTACIP